MAVKIMIDSASDIGSEEAKKLGIIMLPIEVTFGDKQYQDGVDLMPKEFYEKLIASKELPKTSLINQFRWEEAYKEATKDGSELVVLTLSSKISGTYQAALSAAESFKGKVYVVDSMSAAAGERLLGQYALNLAKQNKTAKEIVDLLENNKSRVKVYAMINTLEYLKKGGRISAFTAFAGALMGIKPVVGMIDGEVKVIGKAMGVKKGFSYLNELAKNWTSIDYSMPFGLLWSGTERTMVEKYIQENQSIWQDKTDKMPDYILGGTIGTHIGPNSVGIAYFEKQ